MKYFLCLCLLFAWQNSFAQADSLETEESEMPSTEEREDMPEWYYNFGADGVYNSGNVNRQLLTLRAAINYEKAHSIWGINTTPKYQYGKNSGQLQERELYLDLNNTFFYNQKDIYGLVFGSFEGSNIRKINSRLVGGVGLGFKILGGKNNKDSRVKLSISNALLKEKTDFMNREDRNVWRNSTRIKLKAEMVKDVLYFNNITFFQPSINSNYLRWNALSQLQYKLGRHISLTAALENSFENINAAGVKQNQINALVGFGFSQN